MKFERKRQKNRKRDRERKREREKGERERKEIDFGIKVREKGNLIHTTFSFDKCFPSLPLVPSFAQ